MPELLICVPTYNEADNVGSLIQRLLRLGLDADILVIDDNSPDGTGWIADELASLHPRMSVMHRASKSGIGSAHLDGIRYAYRKGYRSLLTMDADFSHQPEDVPRLLERGVEFDVVVGTRFERADSLEDWNPFRKVMTHVGHILTRKLLRLPYDATGALRFYRLDRIREESFLLVKSAHYAFFFESLAILNSAGFRIGEVPIDLPARVYGHSKMQIRHMVGGLVQLFTLAITLAAARGRAKRGRPSLRGFDVTRAQREWDVYWEAKQDRPSTNALYDSVAEFYRHRLIKPSLNRHIRQSFVAGASVLHAGCGSGEVDMDVRDYVNVTALDISNNALDRYRALHSDKCLCVRGNIMEMSFKGESFDGIYNLGVMEHFEQEDIHKVLKELRRVLKPGGKVILFWPPTYGLSVIALHIIHFVLNRVLHQNTRLHPDEPTKVTTPKQMNTWLNQSGLELDRFCFGFRDLFTYVVIIASKPDQSRLNHQRSRGWASRVTTEMLE